MNAQCNHDPILRANREEKVCLRKRRPPPVWGAAYELGITSTVESPVHTKLEALISDLSLGEVRCSSEPRARRHVKDLFDDEPPPPRHLIPSRRFLHAAVHHTITTHEETLSFAALKNCLASDNISNGNATHIVATIDRGMRSIVTVRQHLVRNLNLSVVKRQFMLEVTPFLKAVQTLEDVGNKSPSRTEQGHKNMDITTYSDILDNEGILMEDFQEAYKFLELIPVHVKQADGGKGLPIAYSLLSVEMLKWLIPDLKILFVGKCKPRAADYAGHSIQLFSDSRLVIEIWMILSGTPWPMEVICLRMFRG
ncbi:MAG: hypothetical protein Q9169_000052 [Polycauliona sp. 2 TL-2023]